ncbi:hypothetical protein IFM89_007481 [Coptis chinensis]|uniref:Uncharacterized protein n=1 Tax=Coptis chinensis TaxID=261450 RepID=A0A835HDJ0_9MAGN|nr:hypothetical protein IFM89_007481 [Coptis chinensis]
MQEHLSHVKQLSDNFTAFGEKINDANLEQIILIGPIIVATLTATLENNIPMNDFRAHLLAFEQRIEAQHALLQQLLVANIATHHRSKPNYS